MKRTREPREHQRQAHASWGWKPPENTQPASVLGFAIGRFPILSSSFTLGCCHRYDFLVRIIGTDLTFSNFLNFYFHLGLITTPHVLYVHMTYGYPSFLMFHSSHDCLAKRSHHRIMILFDFSVLLFYGRIPTLVLFYFLHNPTTSILPVYVDQ